MPKVHSPVKFKLQRRREIFHRRDGAMHGRANDNRFCVINDIPSNNTKFVKYWSPDFGAAADHSLDEYIRNMSSSANETATHQDYHPKHDLVEKNLSVGIRNFAGYTSKEDRKIVLGMGATPDPMSFDEVKRGFNMTMKHQDIVPFKLLGGRDDKLYERQHGLPKHSVKEQDAKLRRFKKRVSCHDFLPNSIAQNPKKKLHSATFKTQVLGLYNVRGGWGHQRVKSMVDSGRNNILAESFEEPMSAQFKPGLSPEQQAEGSQSVDMAERDLTTDKGHSPVMANEFVLQTHLSQPAEVTSTVLKPQLIMTQTNPEVSTDLPESLEAALQVGPRLLSQNMMSQVSAEDSKAEAVTAQMIMLDLDHDLNNESKLARPESKLFGEIKQARINMLQMGGARTHTAAVGTRKGKHLSTKSGFNKLIPEKIAV